MITINKSKENTNKHQKPLMLSITEVIEQLKRFKECECVTLIEILKGLEILKNPEKTTNNTIESLRKKLNAILASDENKNITKDDLSLSKAAYNALLAVVKIKPINDLEPISLEKISEIEDDRLIYLSTGHVYHVNLLVKWIKTKKEYINPLTNMRWLCRKNQSLCYDY